MKSAQLSLFDTQPPDPTLRDVADMVRLAGIEGLPEATRLADTATYQEVRSRSALTRTTGMPFRWALNPYRGCTHACEYCYARKYQRHLDLDAGDQFSAFILVKRDLPGVLARELARPSWAREMVAVGTATDPYQPIEGRYQITRRCLALLADAQTPFSVVTKGPMIVRDRDVLLRATRGAGCQVFMSVPSVDEEVCRALEPGTAPPRQRLLALKALADAGVRSGVLMMPLVPGFSTSRSGLEATVTAVHEHGLTIAGTGVARLDAGVREHFFAFLERDYPSLVDGYRRLYSRTHADETYVREVRARVREIRLSAGTAGPECGLRSADATRTTPSCPRRRKAS